MYQPAPEYSNPFSFTAPNGGMEDEVGGAPSTFFKSAEQLKRMMVASGSKKPRYGNAENDTFGFDPEAVACQE